MGEPGRQRLYLAERRLRGPWSPPRCSCSARAQQDAQVHGIADLAQEELALIEVALGLVAILIGQGGEQGEGGALAQAVAEPTVDGERCLVVAPRLVRPALFEVQAAERNEHGAFGVEISDLATGSERRRNR